MSDKANKLTARFFLAAGAALVFAMMTAGVAEMQAKQPYDKDKLLRVVQLNALPTNEVVQAIQQRGVDFKMTGEIEGQFRSAGARPEVVDAIRGNYRAPAGPPPSNPPSNPNPPSNTRPSTVPAGPPLAKNEIITLLQSGVPTTRVEQFVEVRGVNFSITPQIAREIKDAGGNNALIGAITAKAREPQPSNPGRPGPVVNRPGPVAPDYDDLTDKAFAAMQANNTAMAIRLLQQAVAIDSSKPQAYGLLGFAELYGSRDILAADRSMRAAIERGGAAPFRVYHDHDGLFNTFCQGSLFVSRTNVTYKADDGNHTFEASRTDIKEAKVNPFMGVAYAAFHIKVNTTAARKGDNYNFAPRTKQKAEASLITSLIQSNQ